MFNSILVVCTGNIYRSPLAERLLREKLPNKKADLTGVGALVDNPANRSATNVVDEHELLLKNHEGIQFSASLARKYDPIPVVGKTRLEQAGSIASKVGGRTMLLGHWDNRREIPDPYKKSEGAFDSVFILIDKACQSWVDKLSG